MEPQELVVQIFERIWSVTDSALDGLTYDELTVRPAPDSNSMGWIAWHLTRVEDRWFHSIAGGADEVWRRGWAVRLGMGDLLDTTGGGMPKEQVDAFNTPTLEQLQGYQAAVRQETKAYLSSLSSEDFDREIETWFGRTMSIGQVFAHVSCELNQHVGQLSYLKGYLRSNLGEAI